MKYFKKKKNLTRIYADKALKKVFYTENAEDKEKTKKLSLFWLAPKNKKLFLIVCRGHKR